MAGVGEDAPASGPVWLERRLEGDLGPRSAGLILACQWGPGGGKRPQKGDLKDTEGHGRVEADAPA